MPKKFRVYVISFLALAALLVSAFSAGAFAKGQNHSNASTQFATSAKPATARVVSMHTIDMQNVATTSPKASNLHAKTLPLLQHVNKSTAASSKNAPHFKGLSTTSLNNGPFTPSALASFHGMANSPTVCPPSGCQPPDMAVAASPRWVFQGVNTAYAVYNTSGHIQPGWPKNAQDFFGIPNLPHNCDPAGPFLSDPRAFYDINDGRFWAAILQVEDAVGIAPKCPEQTLYWIAVSQTNNPNGVWNVYAFDMSLGTTNVADYTQIGFDAHAFYFNANMYTQDGSAYAYDELFGANKQRMEQGQSVTGYGFFDLKVNNVLVDTVQPTEGEFPTYAGPPDGIFINSFNSGPGEGDPTGNDCVITACHGVEIWALNHPGTASTTLKGAYVDTPPYLVPPNADQPGCTQCIETIDTRITATPIFNNGQISWSLDTAARNSTQVVPAILWGQVVPQIANGVLKGGILYQSGYFGFEGDQDASFGALMPDLNGNLIMVYDTMSSTLNPSIAYTGRRATFPLGSFHDAGIFLQKGLTPTKNSRWGDYEATSYDGFSTDHIWMASQYSGANHDWHTAIGETQFVRG